MIGAAAAGLAKTGARGCLTKRAMHRVPT